MTDDTETSNLIQPNETAFRLELTAAQLKVTYGALRGMLNDLGHDEADVRHVVQEVLGKLPDEHAIRAIDLNRELEALRRQKDA